jgi:hypothetical protein
VHAFDERVGRYDLQFVARRLEDGRVVADANQHRPRGRWHGRPNAGDERMLTHVAHGLIRARRR